MLTKTPEVHAKGSKLLLDACVFLQTESSVLDSLVRRGFTLLVTPTILNEVERISQLKDQHTEAWRIFARHLVFLDDRKLSVVLEAQHILTHVPDNLHIAAAKVEGATILSYDRLMVSTARDEGVEAYRPEEFLDRMVN